MRRLTLAVAAIIALLGAAVPPSAQQLVTLEVTAFDRDGRPVRDLSAADFTVTLKGQAQAVRAAMLVGVPGAMLGAIGPSFDAVTPAPAAAVYRLSVETPADSVASLAVAVNRRNVGAAITRHAAPAPASAPRPAANASPAMSTDERLRAAVGTGRGAGGIDVAIGTSVRRGRDPNQVTLDIAIDIPASAAGPLQSMLGVVNERGSVGTARKQLEAENGGAPYHADLSVPVAPGAYTVRFAAADAGGAIGLGEAKVDAKLAALGPLLASSLFRATLDAQDHRRPLTRDKIPADAKTLVVALELYPTSASMPADVLVKLALVRASGDDATVVERVVTPEARDGALAAEAEFAVDRLPPGKYALRATVLSGAVTLGSISATVER